MSQLSRIILIVAMNVLMYVLAVERYSDQFDDIDMDAILRNDTQREEYHKCYMNTGPCNTMQEALTELYGEALLTNCKKCTETQKGWMEKIIKWYAKYDTETLFQQIAKAAINMQKQKTAD
ncbi:PREDICTED: putative odorant-binding protein A10 [Trachymyrmex cornetzi]|uniref:putative odorant-binding protein A10 n=1 Tax=Trachymyrmex cornetzi TaxID=471704 RepID=UPI00084F5524|nr:PREDICTED: putative odorant-binding protein A10 [Trachymyrmex cornetzi]